MKKNGLGRVISIALSLCLLFQQAGLAQALTELNLAGYLAAMKPPAIDKFRPLHLRYFEYNGPNSSFNLLLDKGDLKAAKDKELASQSQELFKYFLIGITLPNESFWVNLRPDSEDQIINPLLAQTDIGKAHQQAYQVSNSYSPYFLRYQ